MLVSERGESTPHSRPTPGSPAGVRSWRRARAVPALAGRDPADRRLHLEGHACSPPPCRRGTGRWSLVAVLASVAGAFFYLRLIVLMYVQEPAPGRDGVRIERVPRRRLGSRSCAGVPHACSSASSRRSCSGLLGPRRRSGSDGVAGRAVPVRRPGTIGSMSRGMRGDPRRDRGLGGARPRPGAGAPRPAGRRRGGPREGRPLRHRLRHRGRVLSGQRRRQALPAAARPALRVLRRPLRPTADPGRVRHRAGAPGHALPRRRGRRS